VLRHLYGWLRKRRKTNPLDHPELVDFLLHIDQLAENTTFKKYINITMPGLEKEEKQTLRPPGAR
jgi:hypothetical protein